MLHQVKLPDFDTLVTLYQTDPIAFEAFRRHALQEAIAAAPPHLRPGLEKIVRHINITRLRADCPHEAAAIAFRLMCGSLVQLQYSWRDLAAYSNETASNLRLIFLKERFQS